MADEKKPQNRPKTSAGDAFLKGLIRGSFIGEPIEALTGALAYGDPNKSLYENFTKAQEAIAAQRDKAFEDAPVSSYAGYIPGMAASLALPAGRLAKEGAARYLQMAGLGAAYGGVGGALDDTQDRLGGAARGAIAGGVAGPVLGRLADNLASDIPQWLSRKPIDDATEALLNPEFRQPELKTGAEIGYDVATPEQAAAIEASNPLEVSVTGGRPAIQDSADYIRRANSEGLDFINSPEAVDFYTKNAGDIRAQLDAGIPDAPSALTDQEIERRIANDPNYAGPERREASVSEAPASNTAAEMSPLADTPEGSPETIDFGPKGVQEVNILSEEGLRRRLIQNDLPVPEQRQPAEPGDIGSISPENLRVNPEEREALKTVADASGLDRKFQSRAETQEMARRLNLTADQYINDPSLAEVPVKIAAGKQLVEAHAADLLTKAREFGVDTPEFTQAVQVVQKVVAKHSANAGEAGRALNILGDVQLNARGEAEVGPAFAKVVGDLTKTPKDLARLNELVEKYKDSPDAVKRIVRDATKYRKAKFSDYLQSGFYNSYLSGTETISRNILGNIQNLIGDLGTHAVTSGIGQFSRLIDKDAERVYGREVNARVIGAWRGMLTGLKNAPEAYRNATPLDIQYREGGGSPFHSAAAMILEYGTRVGSAVDEVARAAAYTSDLYGAAARQAIKEGKVGLDTGTLLNRIDEIVKDPSQEMINNASDYARLMRFQDEPGLFARHVERMLKVAETDTPVEALLKMGVRFTVVPFVRTPSSIIRTAARNSPLGVLSGRNYRDFVAGGVRRQLAVGRVAIGSSIASYVFHQAYNGEISGTGPGNADARARLEATGWQPNSIKFGDTWISYDNLGPLSTMMSVAATTAEQWKAGETEPKDFIRKTGDLSLGIADAMLQNGWTESLAQVMGILRAPDDQRGTLLENFGAQFAAGLTVPAVLRQYQKNVNDPILRDNTADNTFTGKYLAKVDDAFPGNPLSSTGVIEKSPARLDILGREQKTEKLTDPYHILDIFSPFKTSPVDTDPVANEILDLQKASPEGKAPLGRTPKYVKFPGDPKSYRLNADQAEQYQELTGKFFDAVARPYVTAEGWKDLPAEARQGFLKELAGDARAFAREQMFGEGANEGPDGPPEASATEDGDEFPYGTISSGRRTSAGNKVVGGVSNSKHLSGKGIDLVPNKGVSMEELARHAEDYFPGAEVINEGDHVHVEADYLDVPYYGKKGTQ